MVHQGVPARKESRWVRLRLLKGESKCFQLMVWTQGRIGPSFIPGGCKHSVTIHPLPWDDAGWSEWGADSLVQDAGEEGGVV